MPCAWAAASARQICPEIFKARATSSAPSRSITLPSSTPSRYSITKYTLPSAVAPQAVASTMFGWPVVVVDVLVRRAAPDRAGLANRWLGHDQRGVIVGILHARRRAHPRALLDPLAELVGGRQRQRAGPDPRHQLGTLATFAHDVLG